MVSITRSAMDDDFYRIVLDAIPFPVFVVEDDMRIVDFNAAASKMLAQERELVISRRAGEALHCLHSTETPEGCGRAPFCQDCIIRNSVNESLRGRKRIHQKVRMDIIRQGESTEALFLVTTVPCDYKERKLVLVILEDISELLVLSSILPICANCKKINIDRKYWESVESYLKTHLEISFSHGLCPECVRKLYPEHSDALTDI
jgi:PAS domain-containing protein